MNRAESDLSPSIKIGAIVYLARLGGTRYVVAECYDDMVRLVRRRPEGGYASFVRAIEGLVAEPYPPFKFGESVKVNAIPETGTFVLEQDGVALVDMPAWSKPLRGDPNGTKLSIDPSTARVSLWSLVLENKL